ncbi:MAG: ACP S-malonyltransferase [Hyphomonadaceae bacterium]|nr:ACP S-malonyltransferase [Clostridia bacterium]
MKKAILFAGQGAQYVGMGKSLYESNAHSKVIFDAAGEVATWCFEGPKELLNQTQYTQPSVFTVSIAVYEAIKAHGVKVDAVAGFSLGEYAALVAGGVLSFTQCLKLVRQRGQWMEQAVPSGGGMAAVLGATEQTVQEILSRVTHLGICEAVNFNCPGQIVIAGQEQPLAQAAILCKEYKAKYIKLPVSVPAHTSMLAGVAQKIESALNEMDVCQPIMPIMSNVTGEAYKADELVATVAKQVMRPVLWEKTIRNMIADGFDTFIEVGPGKTLSGLVKKIDSTVTIINIEDAQSLENAIAGGLIC